MTPQGGNNVLVGKESMSTWRAETAGAIRWGSAVGLVAAIALVTWTWGDPRDDLGDRLATVIAFTLYGAAAGVILVHSSTLTVLRRWGQRGILLTCAVLFALIVLGLGIGCLNEGVCTG